MIDSILTTEAPLNLDPGAQRAWLLAGNATFTLVSNKTGKRFTYKIQRDKLATSERYHVKLMTGPDNEASFEYLGALRPRLRKVETGGVFDIEEEYFEFYLTSHDQCWALDEMPNVVRPQFTKDSPVAVAFNWMWKRIKSNIPLTNPTNPSRGAKLLHAGRCGRCGRKLTVPKSIESGYGPECGAFSAPGIVDSK